MATEVTPHHRPFYAMALRLAAVGVLSTLTLVVKYSVESGIAFAEVLFWRQALTVPVLLGWLALIGQTARLRTRRLPVHFRRALLGTIGMAFTFGAPVLLPMAEATTLAFTTPLFAVILAAAILKEAVGPWRWSAVAVGFLGVLVIARPDGHLPPFGAFVGLGAGLMVAIISIQVRDLARTDEPLSIVFWFAALSSPVLALFLPFVASAHTADQWLLLGAAGALGCLGQLLLTASLKYGQVGSVIVMDYTALGWSSFYGWQVFGEVPAAATWFGAPLILAAGCLIVWREHRLGKVPSATGTVPAPES